MAERKSFLLRLPSDVLEAMQRWARDDLRSLNAQIEFVLREALRQQKRSLERDPAKREAPIACPNPRAPWRKDPPAVSGKKSEEASVATDHTGGISPLGQESEESGPTTDAGSTTPPPTDSPAQSAPPAARRGTSRSPYVGTPSEKEILREWAEPVPWLMREAERDRVEHERRQAEERERELRRAARGASPDTQKPADGETRAE